MRDLKIFTENIEQEAIDQINTLLDQPAFADCKVRIMPDVHAGAGCVIGFTANLGDKVIPNIVGVDIGCGMLTVNLGKIDIDYEKLDAAIRLLIPAGRNVHGEYIPEKHLTRAKRLIAELRCRSHLHSVDRLEHSLGTLGGGNHFIEIDESSKGNKYLIIHTGSRNLGKQVADYYQNLAYKTLYDDRAARSAIISTLKLEGRETEIQTELAKLKRKGIPGGIPKDLCYLEGVDRNAYLHDMQVCQRFAMINRNMIAVRIIDAMGWNVKVDMFDNFDWFHTVHNYIELGSNMVRKGAISAYEGEKLLIPINMRDGCIIGRGKGNEDWNCSAPHGAGRIMSRAKAREVVSLDEFKESMDGIYTTSVSVETVDEAPMVYKPMDEIIENIKDTVDILEIIKPVYNFKASEV